MNPCIANPSKTVTKYIPNLSIRSPKFRAATTLAVTKKKTPIGDNLTHEYNKISYRFKRKVAYQMTQVVINIVASLKDWKKSTRGLAFSFIIPMAIPKAMANTTNPRTLVLLSKLSVGRHVVRSAENIKVVMEIELKTQIYLLTFVKIRIFVHCVIFRFN